MPIGNGVVLIGMGERSSHQAIGQLAVNLFKHKWVEKVIVAGLPKSRAAMHLDTVFSFYDRDVVTIFPEVVNQIRAFTLRPDEGKPGGIDICREEINFLDTVALALNLKALRVVENQRQQLRRRTRAMGQRQQRGGCGAGRGHRLRPQHLYQHPAAQGRMDPRAPRLASKRALSLTTIVGTPPGASSRLQWTAFAVRYR